MAPPLAAVRDGVAARCGKGGRMVAMVVGRKEQTWQRFHAVSRFGRARAAEPEGGVY